MPPGEKVWVAVPDSVHRAFPAVIRRRRRRWVVLDVEGFDEGAIAARPYRLFRDRADALNYRGR
jgi:hypothetical protein